MREIVVISGKGGTGKTSITAAFAHVADNVMLCDLDVDAPDLHLLLAPRLEEEHAFRSGYEAYIDPLLCTGCGLCASLCQFDAVRKGGTEDFQIDPLRCEGCKVCVHFCPAKAVAFTERYCGQWYVSSMRFGPMVHARLFPGQENSGRLVAILKKEARQRAESQGIPLVLCDGAPGIGCPVISSLSGAGLAVIVTEPTPSGRHDLARVAELCTHFRIPASVIINKYDLNTSNSREIEQYCRHNGHELLGMLPYDEVVTQAMLQGQCVTEMPEAAFAKSIRDIWQRIVSLPSGGRGHLQHH
ncbi:MinD superfamily P-loop ATPase, contains an inserted ferredoxin domain [Desulfonatronum thiosulfatophilum]|uniref:MinD superfamily P-loop ATPase, contains an inserted ferredoxin domain n=1 Tax=Desulfonatronum thiosulfatophilum TaxID=617002 RepID=A0A1G6CXJ2_9BACT|nr:ATP-binding protein [Desulfonatronum thiosulfatophilum]SDB37596.1 MinD superfamily P-loop ATPase, contains an inserted ferredoxin domain [Desulfonatronum thiosulfatophilum]